MRLGAVIAGVLVIIVGFLFGITIIGLIIGIPLIIAGFIILIYGLLASDKNINININTGEHGGGGGQTRTLSEFKFCQNCGSKIAKSAAFCPNCGEQQK
ncbi:MAG: zinc ribbon domain-containing protein [Thermoprotei archaeon]